MARIAVLGTAHGHIFSLVAAAKKTAGHELIGVYDDDADRLATAATKMETRAISSLSEILAAKPDLVMIGAVPSDRAELAEAALNAGAAALLDKPIALSFEVLRRLEDAVKRTGRPLAVYYPYRGSPELRTMRQYLREGKIGKLVRIFTTGPHLLAAATRPQWHWTRANNGGILIDIGSHYLDLCNWLADDYPDSVNAVHTNLNNPEHPEFQDFGLARLHYPDGAYAVAEVDWFSPKGAGYDTRVWVQGTTGKMEYRAGANPTLHLWTDTIAGDAVTPDSYPSMEQWTAQMIADLAAGGDGEIPQQDIWNASRLSLQAYDSAVRGQTVMTSK